MNLKPCPWCNQVPEEIRKNGLGFFVACSNFDCKVDCSTMYQNAEKDAIKLWNGRKERNP